MPQKRFDSNPNGTRRAKAAGTMLDRLPSQYLKFAVSAYGRQFTSDADLIHALKNEHFKKRADFLRIMTESFGFEFSSPLEVFRFVSGERLPEFGPLSPLPGNPTAFQVAAKAFGRKFSTPKELADFIDEVPSRETTFQKALIAAGWRAKRKRPTRRISLEKADHIFSGLVKRIAQANSIQKFAFFVQEILVYGSYLRRDDSGRNQTAIPPGRRPGFRWEASQRSATKAATDSASKTATGWVVAEGWPGSSGMFSTGGR